MFSLIFKSVNKSIIIIVITLFHEETSQNAAVGFKNQPHCIELQPYLCALVTYIYNFVY